MPIRPENRCRYPANWKAISAAVRADAGNRCEGSPDFPDCRVANGALGARTADGVWLPAEPMQEIRLRLDWPNPGMLWWCSNGERREYLRIVRIVLTVAHLDHQPENCDRSNLRAWCQRCHLWYDRHHHAQTRYQTRRDGAAASDLFEASNA